LRFDPAATAFRLRPHLPAHYCSDGHRTEDTNSAEHKAEASLHWRAEQTKFLRGVERNGDECDAGKDHGTRDRKERLVHRTISFATGNPPSNSYLPFYFPGIGALLAALLIGILVTHPSPWRFFALGLATPFRD
jgi:hypothetical protein